MEGDEDRIERIGCSRFQEVRGDEGWDDGVDYDGGDPSRTPKRNDDGRVGLKGGQKV